MFLHVPSPPLFDRREGPLCGSGCVRFGYALLFHHETRGSGIDVFSFDASHGLWILHRRMRTRQYRIRVFHDETVEQNRSIRIQSRITDLHDDHRARATVHEETLSQAQKCTGCSTKIRRAYLNKVALKTTLTEPSKSIQRVLTYVFVHTL